MSQVNEFTRRVKSGRLLFVLVTVLICVLNLVYNTMKENNNKDSHHQRLSFVYEDLGLSVYGRWMEGFKHERRNISEDHRLKCVRSVRERPLHFVFNDDRLNSVNAVVILKDILEHNGMLLVGDSTIRELGLGICALLDLKPTFHRIKKENYICENITYHQGHKIDIHSTLVRTHLSEDICKADFIVINQGLHYHPFTINDVHLRFDTLGQFLFNETRNSSKMVVVRSTTPQHYFTERGSGLFHERINTRNTCETEVRKQHPTNYLLMEMAMKYNFKYFDTFPMYYQRGDLIPGKKVRGVLDCTHHCYTPEVIWAEVVLLSEAIKSS